MVERGYGGVGGGGYTDLMSNILPPDPAGELQTGPADNWQPSRTHLRVLQAWTETLHKLGIPNAEAIAFELWKIKQKIESGKL